MGMNPDNKNSDNNGRKPNKPGNDDNNVNRMMRSLLLGIGVIAAIIFMYSVVQGTQEAEWPVTFNQYQQFLEKGLIEEAVVVKSQMNDIEFQGVLKEEQTIPSADGKGRAIQRFTTKLPYLDPEITAKWEQYGVDITIENGDSPWGGILIYLLPLLVIFALFMFTMRRMQGGGGQRGLFSFGKARVHLINENARKVTFKDVAGADEAKCELEEVIDFLKEPAKFQRLGGKIPRGILLLGPPGTGKTLLARAVAGEAEVPFFSISGADFVEMFVGVGASRVRDLFEQAKKSAPCIVFIDEIDAVGRQRGAGVGGGHDEREQTLNPLLVEMDGFEQNSGVIVVAATNRPDVLDPALLRPGRFDRQVVVDRPDVKGRLGILKVHTKHMPVDSDVDLEIIARGTPGLSGADLANLMNESALLAARRDSPVVNMVDVENARDKILMGVERRSMVISDQEKRVTAYHEMGHALAAMLQEECDPVHKVTIIPRGRALGVTSTLPKEDMHSYNREYLIARIVMLLAGRAAEKIVFNKITNGASNDIERATGLARKMVCEWGMSDEIGPLFLSANEDEMFLAREIQHHKNVSEATAQKIDEEVRNIVFECMQKAEQLLTDNLELLHKTSEYLLVRETIDLQDIQDIRDGKDPQLDRELGSAFLPGSANTAQVQSTSDSQPVADKEADENSEEKSA